MPGGVVGFIREQKEWPIPSPAMLGIMTRTFRKAVEEFAAEQGLEIVTFSKEDDKDAIAQACLAQYSRKSGVVLIGKAQEKARSFKGRRADRGSKVWFVYTPVSVLVTFYYFYIFDEDFGLTFIKACTYLPFEVKVCFNGHEWAKRQLSKEGIAFEALENGFASCADPARLQALCHQLNPEKIQAFFDRWVGQLPWPLTAREREAGYKHELSVWQLEVSRTQVFVDPEQGRALVETLIRDNLDLGRPDRVSLIFDRQVTKRTPSEFHTQVIQYGVMPSIRIRYKHSVLKQYLKEGRALRTEMMINNASDFNMKRSLKHFPKLVAAGRAFNDRLLEQEHLSQDCFVPLGEIRRLGQSTLSHDGHRASALRFGDQRVMAVMSALSNFSHIQRGLSNKPLREQVAQLLNLPASEYSSAQMSYDLRRLRLKNLISRIPNSHTYALTELGTKVAVFFTKLYNRLFQPGLAALVPDQLFPSKLAQALTTVSDLIQSSLNEVFLASSAKA
ncbi:MAG: hypothetical protein HY673_08450 [Chloroflexi bacterium]|nr:hypothetical protein [Chloroflexota bacterium]